MTSTFATADGNYVADRFAFISSVEKDVWSLYNDGGSNPGFPTIGVGFNLAGNQAVFDAVLKGFGFSIGDPYESTAYRSSAEYVTYARPMYDAIQDALGNDDKISSSEVTSLLTALNLKMRAWSDSALSQNRQTTFAFQNDDQVQTAFNTIADHYEKLVDTYLENYNIDGLGTASTTQTSGTYERIALFSLAYNSRVNATGIPTTLGPGLASAILAGNRADAWYQIRYATNGDQSRGLAKRRYYESQLIGLTKKDLSTSDQITEDITALATITARQAEIDAYNKRFSDEWLATQANNDYSNPVGGPIKSTADLREEVQTFLQHQFGYDGVTFDYVVAAGRNADGRTTTVDLTKLKRTNGSLIFGALSNAAGVLKGVGGDIFIAGAGAENIDGGMGGHVSYQRSTAGVDVTMGGRASGGFAEGDTLNNIVGILGSEYNDKLSGYTSMAGGAGNDLFVGSKNGGWLIGGAGNDRFLVNGGAGTFIDPGTGDDGIIVSANGAAPGGGTGLSVRPGDGHDTVVGHAGVDFQGVQSSEVRFYTNWSVEHVTDDSVEGTIWNYDVYTGRGFAITYGNGDSLYFADASFSVAFDVTHNHWIEGGFDHGVTDPWVPAISFDGILFNGFGVAGWELRPDDIQNGATSFNTLSASAGAGRLNGPGGSGDIGPVTQTGAPTSGKRNGSGSSKRSAAAFTQATHDPMVIDLSGNGLNLTSLETSSTYFSWAGNGITQNTGWIGSGSGFLVNDANGDGQIDSTELLGSNSATGFTVLSSLDTNSDGTFDSSDDSYNNLSIWQDFDGDGVAQAAELSPLSSTVRSITLNPQSARISLNGNTVHDATFATMIDGTHRTVADVSFAINTVDVISESPVDISPETNTLPQIACCGQLLDLRSAMTTDETLLAAVQSLVAISPSNTIQFDAALQAVMLKWAGADSVDSASRGGLFNAQKLAFLEAYIGIPFVTQNGTNPSNATEAGRLAESWQAAFQGIKARILAQDPASPMSSYFDYDETEDTITPKVDFSAIVDDLASGAPSDGSSILGYWTDALTVLNASVQDYAVYQSDLQPLLLSKLTDVLTPLGFSSEILSAVAMGSFTYFDVAPFDSPNPAGSTIDGTDGADLFRITAPNMTVLGQGGGDEFVIGRGIGALRITEYNNNVALANSIRFEQDVSPNDISVTTNSSGNVILTIGAAGDQVILDNELLSRKHGVQSIVFSDGTTWSRDQLLLASSAGTSGNDVLFGTSAADEFDGHGGSDVVHGNGGGDTFRFGLGYGHLEIDEIDAAAAPNNVLAFATGISPGNIRVSGDAAGDLVLTDGISGDQIVLDGALTGNACGVQTVAFSDGTMWTRQDLLNAATTGASSADIIYGSTGVDVFDGYGGGDIEVGGLGSDTYVFKAGYGRLEIRDSAATENEANVLQFGAGIAPGDVLVSADSSGNVMLSVGSNGDVVVLDSMASNVTAGMQSVSFADGTTWTRADVLARIQKANVFGSVGNDVLAGTSAGEFFDGHGGNDVAVGGGGADTFIFNSGYGNLDIRDADFSSEPNSTLQFGIGISPSDLSVSQNSSGDVIINVGTNGDLVTLRGMLASSAEGVQRIVFADGTAWSRLYVSSLATTGTIADETLSGTSGDDIFDGKGGDDAEIGNGGHDTFIFNSGYGHLTIDQQSVAGYSSSSTLRFGGGISPADVVIESPNENGDVVINIGGGGDQVTLTGATASGDNDGVQIISFADGTIWNLQQVLPNAPLTVMGTPENDTLWSEAYGVTYDGEGGFDTVVGRGGGDTFIYNLGYGELNIYELDGAANPTNKLQLGQGIAVSAVTVTADNGSICLSIGANGDKVVLDGMADSSSRGVQSVLFADGTVWTRQDVLNQISPPRITGTTGNDTLTGTSGADVFDGKGGSDLIEGNGGNDTFLFNAGYGNLTIYEYDAAQDANNVLEFGAGVDPNWMSVYADGYGDAILVNNATDDVVVIASVLYSDKWGPQSIHFADGTTWNRQNLIDRVGILGTVGNDTLTGTGGVDVFDGKGGSDLVEGNGGNDIFLFNPGYGNLTIYEYDAAAGANNILEFGAGVNPYQMSVYADAYGDAILVNNATNDVVVIASVLYSDKWGPQSIYFSDATWSRQDLIDHVGILGTAGNDTLTGTSGVDVFDGKGGSDHIQGNGGNDIFLFNTGYGNLEIDEVDNAENANNVLEFGVDVDPLNILVSSNTNGDVLLTNKLNGDAVTLHGMLNSSANGVQAVYFENSTWSRQTVLAMATS